MDASHVTVVIPYWYNHLMYLQKSVDSAYAAGAARVIIVCDGFVDEELDWYGVTQNVTELKTGVRSGVCYARNLGIGTARTNLILPLDADDTLLPGAINALTAAYEPGTFVYGNWLENGVEVKSAPPEMLNRKSVAGCTFLFAQADWQRVGGYDKDFEIGGEDYAFMVALVNAGVRPVRIDVPIYNRTLSESGRSAKTKARWPMIHALLREKYPDFFPLAREIYERI